MLPPQDASDDPDKPVETANPELYGRLDFGKIFAWLILGVVLIYISGLFVYERNLHSHLFPAASNLIASQLSLRFSRNITFIQFAYTALQALIYSVLFVITFFAIIPLVLDKVLPNLYFRLGLEGANQGQISQVWRDAPRWQRIVRSPGAIYFIMLLLPALFYIIARFTGIQNPAGVNWLYLLCAVITTLYLLAVVWSMQRSMAKNQLIYPPRVRASSSLLIIFWSMLAAFCLLLGWWGTGRLQLAISQGLAGSNNYYYQQVQQSFVNALSSYFVSDAAGLDEWGSWGELQIRLSDAMINKSISAFISFYEFHLQEFIALIYALMLTLATALLLEHNIRSIILFAVAVVSIVILYFFIPYITLAQSPGVLNSGIVMLITLAIYLPVLLWLLHSRKIEAQDLITIQIRA